MEKLLDDKELSTSEIVYIGRNLSNTEWKERPFDHSAPTSLEACGISQVDIDELNKKFKEILSKENLSISKMVEMLEKIVAADERYFRMVVWQALQYSYEKSSNISDILKTLLGGGAGGKKEGDKE